MDTIYSLVDSPGHIFPDHPESPMRLSRLLPDEWPAPVSIEPFPARADQVARVHTPDMIAGIGQACRHAPAIIDHAPTFVTATSYDDALLAAGGTIACAQAVLRGGAHNGFALVRPPGHHAEPDRAMGFCLFNNLAIAVHEALAQGLERVLIVDYDAHHGNGTQAIFLDEPRVAFLSTHQEGIYPGTGRVDDAPHARQRIVNVPLPAFSGDATYMQVMERLVRPLAEHVRPQMVFVSAGFDAHWRDPLTSLGLTTAGYFAMSKFLVDLAQEFCGGKVLFVLEGGYDAENVSNGARAVFAALAGAGDLVDAGDANPRGEPETGPRLDEIRAWHGWGPR
jgi:acetoin utilization deacetylase AcuC-like enzyme